MTKYPSQMQDKFNLRFPEGMRDEIADAAKQSGRSMNSEIIYRLQQSFDKSKASDNEERKEKTIQFKSLQIAESRQQYDNSGPLIALIEKAISILKEADDRLSGPHGTDKVDTGNDKD